MTSSSAQRGSSSAPGLVPVAPEFLGAIGDPLLGECDELDGPEFLEVIDELLLEGIVDDFQRFSSDSSGLGADLTALVAGRLGADLAALEVVEGLVEEEGAGEDGDVGERVAVVG